MCGGKVMQASRALSPLITHSQILLAELLDSELPDDGVRRDQYIRYLRMQYHLTKGVQWYFMAVAAHASLSGYRRLRQFLFDFSNEEELHYEVAKNDLAELGEDVGTEPLEVRLWHAHFRNIVQTRPFVRLGAAAILENASAGPVKAKLKQGLSSPFLSRANTKFIVLHQHETLPHGDQILAALDAEHLKQSEAEDLVEGAQVGTVLFYRMVEWSIAAKSLSHFAENVRPSAHLQGVD
jgi:heme oxygenase